MPAEVRLPQAGMGMTDGTVLDWLKQVGDQVSKGECIAEVEAAKTTLEIEAPCDGVLASIVTPAGTLVPVREVMAVIALPGEAAGAAPAPAPAGSAPAAAGSAPAAAGSAPATAGSPPAAAGSPPAAPAPAAPGPPAPAVPGPPAPAVPAVQVVPAARRLARENGIGLAAVAGSGPGGRITEADVRAYLEGQRTVPLTGTRGLIARRMAASLRDSAQFTLTRTADVTDLVGLHDRGGLPGGVTYTDLLCFAAVRSLAEHPALNAHIAEGQIKIFRSVHLGVGIDAGGTLIVGVIQNADAMALAGFSARRRALAQRVRSAHADVTELQGGTFTVTNLGSAGIDAFTPIINPPEVAILGIGRIGDQPVPDGAGVAWRKALTLSLTVDHRAVDGAPAARFLATLAGRLAAPGALLRQPAAGS